ncbi:MAG: biotin/lipoyl-binding protein [Pseudomonadota bacterium]
MDRHPPQLAISGSAMDRVLPKRRGKRVAIAALLASALAVAGFVLWQAMPRGLQVEAHDLRIASVEQGVFRDDIVIRATAEPLNAVILDSIESGRVEEVFARDGAMVAKGQLLFRLSNPQRNLELLARQAEHAQQISNLSNLRLSQEAARSEHQRRLSDLAFAFAQGQKQHARNVALAAQGFISEVALEESHDRLAQQRHALAQENTSSALEAGVRRDALAQMESASKGLQSGLLLVNATVDALAVRAPSAGMLTGFRLQVGQTVKPDQHIGRIDDPRHFKLLAQVDEFYLNRVAPGRQGSARHGDSTYAVALSTIYPQIKDGRFTVEMAFSAAQPATLSPGQSMDAQLTLGEPAPATLLPSGAFLADSGGAWVFVLAADGASAVRRPVRLGRRSNSQVEILAGLAPGEKVIVSTYAAFANAERLRLTH